VVDSTSLANETNILVARTEDILMRIAHVTIGNRAVQLAVKQKAAGRSAGWYFSATEPLGVILRELPTDFPSMEIACNFRESRPRRSFLETVETLLDPEEMSTLATLRAGYIPLRNRLIMLHAPLVQHIVMRMLRLGLHYNIQDMEQQGYIGLALAIDKYSPKRAKFSTYAAWWIRHAITRAMQDHMDTGYLASRHFDEFLAEAAVAQF
jgi:DNA-directed RNA polymerase sigma subunit (sigma70/sigma32)